MNTSLTSGVDAVGRFVLANVPSGAITLQVTGSGADATITLTAVRAADAIDLTIVVSGGSVSVSAEKVNGTPVPPPATHANVPVNGVIDSLEGTASAFQFKIGSHEVHGDSTTAFFGDGDSPDSFTNLHDGVRVEVKGEERDGFVFAFRIHVNDGSDGGGGSDQSASIHGTLNAIGGSPATPDLTVGSTTVHTSATTVVKRRGDVQTLAALKIGQSLHVVGTRQPDGSLLARLIEIDDDAAGGEFEIKGALGGLSGTCPSVRFGVNGFSVATSAATTFDAIACTALKSGTKVHVEGTRNADGSVAATRVAPK
jgi:hypothetical protein